MRQCCQLPVFNKTWSKTLGSNQCLWKQAAYEKKSVVMQEISFLTFALHPSLSPCESGFSSTPRLNFLSALGECQSTSGSPARHNWAGDSPPLPRYCPFVKPVIPAELTGSVRRAHQDQLTGSGIFPGL